MKGKQVCLESLRRELNVKLKELGYVVIEAQELPRTIVFKVRKLKSV